MKPARVLVCGGRDFKDTALMSRTLREIAPVQLAHGGARGADEMAELWAKASAITSYVYYADWQQHGRAAGPIRNERMLRDFKPTLVVAFPGGRGTADMVRRARAAGVEVLEVRP